MKAIQKIKRLVKRITSMTLRGRCGGYDRASEGRDPRNDGRARPRPEKRYTGDFACELFDFLYGLHVLPLVLALRESLKTTKAPQGGSRCYF